MLVEGRPDLRGEDEPQIPPQPGLGNALEGRLLGGGVEHERGHLPVLGRHRPGKLVRRSISASFKNPTGIFRPL